MWKALNRIGNASCTTSTVLLAKCGDRNFAWAKPTPAMSSRTVRPPIWVRGSRIAFSNESTLLRNTFSTAHLFGSQFSSGKNLRKTKIEHLMRVPLIRINSLTNTKNVHNTAAGITIGQRLLYLHFQNIVHFRRRRHAKQIRRIFFHFEIFLHLHIQLNYFALISNSTFAPDRLFLTILKDLSTSNFFARKNLKRNASSCRAFGKSVSATINSSNCRSLMFRISDSSPSSSRAFCCHSISTQIQITIIISFSSSE